MLKRRLVVGLVLAALVSGCSAGRAFRNGELAARNGDWDAAVQYFTEAVQEDPDRPEFKIALERAQQSASLEHISRARDFEQKDQLDAALIEYRRAAEMDASNRLAAAKAAELEKTIRERIEASRPKPRIQTLREQAAQQRPLLDPGSRDPLKVNFNNASLRDILRTIGDMSGINVTFDQQFQDRAYTVNLDGVTLEQALQQVLTANQKFYKVLDPKTIIVVDDNPTKHAQYDELVVKVFYISHAEAQELSQTVSTIMRVPQMPVQPTLMANKTANTITVRATAAVVDIIERIIRANDKPRAEVLIDVQILEVNRARAKQFGINLSAYALGFTFSPEVAPPNTSSNLPAGAVGAAAVQPEYDYAGHQHGGLLHERAHRARQVPRERLADEDDREAAAPRRRRPEAHAQPWRRHPGAVDRLRLGCGGRLCQHPAVLVQLPLGRRHRRGHAARDLRRRNHPRAARREQHARRIDRRRGAVGADVRVTKGDHEAAPARRRVEPAGRVAARARAQGSARFPWPAQASGLQAVPVRQRSGDRADGHRHAADAAHRPHARADGTGSGADLHRHAAEHRVERTATTHRPGAGAG